jgi:hypothetical protein
MNTCRRQFESGKCDIRKMAGELQQIEAVAAPDFEHRSRADRLQDFEQQQLMNAFSRDASRHVRAS